MSDFDERLSHALSAGAEGAPDVAGLAQEARRRAGVRRQRLALAGGVAAVLAIAVPVAVVARDGAEDAAPVVEDPTTTITDPDGTEWQTVGRDGAEVELPTDWRAVECEFDGAGSIPVYGPEGTDPCDFDGATAAFYGSATFDASRLPGVVERDEDSDTWSGYVSAGDWVVWVGTPERNLTLRILASARIEGEPIVAAAGWETGAEQTAQWEFPASWGVGSGTSASYGVGVSDRPAGERVVQSLPQQVGDGQVAMYGDVGTYRVTVTAPTRAVAELVLSSVVVDARP